MSEHANTSDAVPRARPHWWPDAEQWQGLPAGLREAAESTVLPAHEELVLPARSALERSAAGTLVYLIWLELLQQTRLSQALLDPASDDAPDDDRFFKNHMRLLSAKNQAWKLLDQARRAAEQSPPEAESHRPPAPQQPRVAGDKPRSAARSAPPSRGSGRRAAAWEVAYGNLSESQREALHRMFDRVPGSGPSLLSPPETAAPR